ncbi:MAG: hypothetical protein IKR28_02670, partial [Selenomonadaceae bacterium]|nr:hypothetical protein [Selenomonadaceae bacterium]
TWSRRSRNMIWDTSAMRATVPFSSCDYCAVKAPGLNGNSATILPFSPSHSIVERQLNAI